MIRVLPLIFIIHPVSEDLRFLNRLIKRLRRASPQQFRYIKLTASESSHQSALTLLTSTKNSLLIFLCHGYSDNILGCDCGVSNVDQTNRFEFGPFVTKANVGNFAGNSIFAFSCFSNGLAEAAVKAGAKCAIGFDSIRFDYESNMEKGKQFKKIRQTVKFEVRVFLYEVITYALTHPMSWSSFEKHIRLILNKRHRFILGSKNKHRTEIASIILEIKNGMKLFGDQKAQFP